jgi:hypothetical protein
MERLTMDRTFKADYLAQLLRERCGYEMPQGVLSMMGEGTERVRVEELENPLNALLGPPGHEDAIGYKPHCLIGRDKKGEASFFVSRYDFNWPWNIDACIQHPYPGLCKMRDGNEGLATRPGKNIGSTESLHKYLRRFEFVFHLMNAAIEMKKRFSPLAGAIDNEDDMMGALYRGSRLYVGAHPESNSLGMKGLSLKLPPGKSIDDVWYTATTLCTKEAMDTPGYDLMPEGLHPWRIFMARMAEQQKLHQKELMNLTEILTRAYEECQKPKDEAARPEHQKPGNDNARDEGWDCENGGEPVYSCP